MIISLNPLSPISPNGLSGRLDLIIIGVANNFPLIPNKWELVHYTYSIYGLSGQWTNSKGEALWTL